MIHMTFLQKFGKIKLPLAVPQWLPSLLPFLNLPDQPNSTTNWKQNTFSCIDSFKKQQIIHPLSALSHYLIFNNKNQTCFQNFILAKKLTFLCLKQHHSNLKSFLPQSHNLYMIGFSLKNWLDFSETNQIIGDSDARNKPAGIYLFKVNIRNTLIMCEICSRLIIKTPERCHSRRSGVFIVNFEEISHCSGVSIVDFEQVNTSWEATLLEM